MRIKFMADYACSPLWHAGGDEVGNIDPANLPLSEGLISDLNTWSDELDRALNWTDPAGTKWPPGFFQAFNEKGGILAQRVREELGPGYEVTEHFWGE